jgi:hypothetical protein
MCWFVGVAMGIATAIIVAVAASSARSNHRDPAEITVAKRDEIATWWSAAGNDVNELKSALADTEEAIRDGGEAGDIRSGCLRMHDAAAVKVPSHLPSPDPTLTAELTAADQDAHAAAHMCLAILARSPNGYSAEFRSTSDESRKHVGAALALIEHALTA